MFSGLMCRERAMRKSFLFLLVASASVPALAAPDDDANDRAARHEAARAERAERAQVHAERPVEHQVERAQLPQQIERHVETRVIERSGGDRPAIIQHSGGDGPAISEQRHQAIEERVLVRGSGRNLGDSSSPDARAAGRGGRQRARLARARASRRRRPGGRRTEQRHPQRNIPRAQDAAPRPRCDRRQPHADRQPGAARGHAAAASDVDQAAVDDNPVVDLTANNWRNHWRSDHRYDWRDHRRRHHSLFHFGFYSDPFGWSYRRFRSAGGCGRILPEQLLAQRPWMYRLPYAPPGYRWIRYYDDALLIDTWDGTVVDVIRDFFW